MSYLLIKICFKEKSLFYFHKKLKIKKKPFLWVFIGGFFGWVFYCQPCLRHKAQERDRLLGCRCRWFVCGFLFDDLVASHAARPEGAVEVDKEDPGLFEDEREIRHLILKSKRFLNYQYFRISSERKKLIRLKKRKLNEASKIFEYLASAEYDKYFLSLFSKYCNVFFITALSKKFFCEILL
jgi:hypothetical protein